MNKPLCKLCQGDMQKKIETKWVNALFFLIVGLLLSLTILGMIIGIPMMIIGLYFGSIKKDYWACIDCDYKA